MKTTLGAMEQFKPYADLMGFKDLVGRTKKEIANTLEQFEKPSISFSGGKDSLVLLHLIQQEMGLTNIDVVFFDSGAELPDTLDFIEKIEKEFGLNFLIVDASPDLMTIAKENGAWGYSGSEWVGYEKYKAEDIKKILIQMPALTAIKHLNTDVQIVGLRAEESEARKNLLKKGQLQFHKHTNCYSMYPLARWTGSDICAYIADRNLPYHPLYDKLFLYKGDPRRQRVSNMMQILDPEKGQIWALKNYYPELYNKLISTFPDFRNYV